MTPQTKLALTGLAAASVAKFYFQKDLKTAALIGFAAVAAIAIITWPDTTPNP